MRPVKVPACMHCRDSVIYAAYCPKLGGKVAVKVYQKSRTSASKLRAIKREAAIMVYLLKKRWAQERYNASCMGRWPPRRCMQCMMRALAPNPPSQGANCCSCMSGHPQTICLLPRSVPNITAYHGAFQTREEICIVMEYCPCGDLLERLLAEGRAFEESRVAEVAATLLSTLQVPD